MHVDFISNWIRVFIVVLKADHNRCDKKGILYYLQSMTMIKILFSAVLTCFFLLLYWILWFKWLNYYLGHHLWKLLSVSIQAYATIKLELFVTLEPMKEWIIKFHRRKAKWYTGSFERLKKQRNTIYRCI